jgi:hypothetical protein
VTGDLDTGNNQFVGRNGLGQISVAMPRALMTREEAMVHAAWLVELAEDYDGEFNAVRAEVRSSSG